MEQEQTVPHMQPKVVTETKEQKLAKFIYGQLKQGHPIESVYQHLIKVGYGESLVSGVMNQMQQQGIIRIVKPKPKPIPKPQPKPKIMETEEPIEVMSDDNEEEDTKSDLEEEFEEENEEPEEVQDKPKKRGRPRKKK